MRPEHSWRVPELAVLWYVAVSSERVLGGSVRERGLEAGSKAQVVEGRVCLQLKGHAQSQDVVLLAIRECPGRNLVTLFWRLVCCFLVCV